MRYATTATFLIAGLFAGSAEAALQTKSMDAVEAEVRAREAALTGDLTKAEKKLRNLYRNAIKQFEKDSASRKQDHKRITKITKILLNKKLRDDGDLQDLLTQGVSGFMLELDQDLDRAEKQLGLLDVPNAPALDAAERLGKANDAFDLALEQTSLKKILKKCAKADVLALKVRKSTDEAVLLHGPITVHRFSYDIATDEYVVKGERFTQGDVNRDLAGNLCNKCHDDALHEVKDSVHFRLTGRTERVLFPGGGAHGMLDRACGLPSTTGLTNSHSDVNLGECAKCHTGRYLPVMEGFFASMFQQMGVSDPQGEATKLIDGGVDCLVCHADEYRSIPEGGILASVAPTAGDGSHSPTAVGSARASRDNADFDRDGMPDLVIDMNGDGTPDAPLMMDTDGDGMPDNQCTVCHLTDDHKFVRGHAVGGDLAASDYPVPPPGVAADPNDPTDLTCQTCHDASALPNASLHSSSHIEKIACETCHIPAGSGITYSLFGQGGALSFGRNPEGKDTMLVVADMYIAGDRADLDNDFEAYRTTPILTWFNGGTSFLAQPLSVRGMPNAKITPFKPMGNGMVFDARFFNGDVIANEFGYDYNAHSMYRFYANGNNAEAFYALDMLDMTPTEVRNITMNAFFDPDPSVQAMGLMLIFPNLVYFDKANFGYEHYLTTVGSPFDQNNDGIIDANSDFNFDMFAAANSGLMQFMGFNGPIPFPAYYHW